jgi:hypothetical protein
VSFRERAFEKTGMFSRFPNAPASIQKLPVDQRGFPVPFFVQWIDGEPDFRVTRRDAMTACVKRDLCWICGQPLGRMKSFAIGPMCAVNRVSAEPPSHPPCARFAAEACPFLSRPLAKRPGTADLEERFGEVIRGEGALPHNPGVTLVWHTLRYSLFFTSTTMFQLGAPQRVEWFREGRAATRAEALDGMNLGLPKLREVAESEGAEATAQLQRQLQRAMKLLPA